MPNGSTNNSDGENSAVEADKSKSAIKASHRVLDPVTRSFDAYMKKAYHNGKRMMKLREYVSDGQM